MKQDKAKQVIVVRKDLNMNPGKLAAQCCHASLGALLEMTVYAERNTHKTTKGDLEYISRELNYWEDSPMYEWLEGEFTKIVVSVDSLEEMEEVYKKVDNANLLHSRIIVDAGHTVFNGVPTPTCFAIGPVYSSDIDPLTRHLKLMK